MATVKAFIRTSIKKTTTAKVRFRLSDGRNKQLFHVSDRTVNPDDWDSKNQCIKTKKIYDETKRSEFNKFVVDRKQLILEKYSAEPTKEYLTTEWLELEIDKQLCPEKYAQTEVKPKSFFDYYNDWMDEYQGTARMKQHYKAVQRMLMRFELYQQKRNPQFSITIDNITPETLRQIETFIKEEHKIYEENKEIYDAVPDSRPPKQRGQNRINKIFRYVRTFNLWAINNEITSNNPFAKFKIKEDVYGTPYYITIDERDHLYRFDLSENPELVAQRDIFVFQCMIGCRIGDLLKFRKDNIINDAIEYIPRKTKEGRPVTVRVPLSKTAKEILSKYNNVTDDKLLPFTFEQDYNYAIKDIFKIAGLTRMLTTINTLTGEEEKKPLNEIASSHLARRTFIGNLYKKVKDPNLVGSLTGHKEGSRAFARYREIDDDMKIDLVQMLEK